MKTPTRRQIIIAASILAVVAILTAVGIGAYVIYDEAETRRLDATSVMLRENRDLPFGDVTKISDLIARLDGELLDDAPLNTENLGPQEITFHYRNLRGREREVKFTVNIVDITPPKIYGRAAYTVTAGYQGDLTNLILSGDDLDDHPAREIAGAYNLNTPGNYQLEYVATDASGNQSRHHFTLSVVRPAVGSPSTSPDTTPALNFASIKAKFGSDATRVGIDVSAWQGEIDWSAVKAAGVEFALIRLGYQREFDGEFNLDRYFERNIDGALAVGLPVGVYFYSCSTSVENAQALAKWTLEKIGGRPLELGITYDWENWRDFNVAGISFRTLNQSAAAFIATVKNAGYNGMLYGSKNYLDNFWRLPDHDIWLAQYYDRPTYEGKFKLWQMSDHGRVPGIGGNVDLDILYLE